MLPDTLNEIRSLGHLLAYLMDHLDWPIDPDATPEDLTFDYTAAELDLPADALRNAKIQRLRPFVAAQPWGIFVLDFAGQKLAIAALRNLLRKVVSRKRESRSDQQKWDLEHLLFIALHRGDEGKAVTFVHFEQPAEKGRTAKLTSFPWTEQSGNRTALEFNLPALKWPESTKDSAAWLAAWQKAFDVEAVTKKFFEAYSDVFHAVEAKVKGVPAKDKRLYTQRLFNRLLFLYFIQRKGWLEYAGRKDYLRALWQAAEQKNESFLNDRLYWAFFHGLNTLVEQKELHSDAELIAIRGKVPFLNGGLFDLEDEYDELDKVAIPNAAFDAVLKLFERFNFTVSESTPLDVEVAVDPEMLGKVFEELVTGRHESGSYYTPRSIVSFMCREALKHYLLKAENDAIAIARFVDDGDPSGLSSPEAVLAALKAVKVCDPACGSGAYLLGMMQELLRLREILFAVHKRDHQKVYDRKLEIIRSNLYGVDLDPFAVNIAKLRLWLSLAVDFSGTAPPPLPNLDFKIERGDSLTAPDPQKANDLVRNAMIEHADELESLKGEFIKAHGAEKKQLRQEIQAIEATVNGLVPDHGPADAIDWRIAFIEVFRNGGFDVVVANPPYVSALEFAKTRTKQEREQLNKSYETATGAYDLYVLFFERGLQILRKNGLLCFITPNKYLSAKYANSLRDYLKAESKMIGIVDISGIEVFTNVAVYPILSFYRKAGDDTNPVWALHPHARDLPEFNLINYKRTLVPRALLSLLPESIWGFLLSDQLPLLQKVIAETVQLQTLGTVCATTTAGEADDYGKLLKDRGTNASYKVVNTGTIEPYYSLWGKSRMTNAGEHYLTPYLDSKHISERRDEIYGSPKIIYAKLGSSCEAFLDNKGEYASMNTNCFYQPKSEISLEYICAYCNSKLFMFIYEQFFGALRMSGGYFQFQSPQLRVMPVKQLSHESQKPYINLVQRIVNLKEADAAADVAALEAEINDRVYTLFGLTRDEIKVIEESR